MKPVWEAAQMILLYRDWIMNMSFTGQALLIRLFQHQWTIIQSFQSYEFHTNIQTKFANTHPKVKLTHQKHGPHTSTPSSIGPKLFGYCKLRMSGQYSQFFFSSFWLNIVIEADEFSSGEIQVKSTDLVVKFELS